MLLWPTLSRSACGRVRSAQNQAGKTGTRRRVSDKNWLRLLEPASIEHCPPLRTLHTLHLHGICQVPGACMLVREKHPHICPQRVGEMTKGESFSVRVVATPEKPGGVAVGVAGFNLTTELACYMRDGSADQRELAATSPTSPYYTPQTRRWRIHDRLSEKVHVPHPAMPDGIIGGG
jgi:hypothetical protein